MCQPSTRGHLTQQGLSCPTRLWHQLPLSHLSQGLLKAQCCSGSCTLGAQAQAKHACPALLQHNEKRAELHRLKEKYPEQAAKLEAQVCPVPPLSYLPLTCALD